MSSTLKVSRKTIGMEVRRGAYDIFVDGEGVGPVALHETFVPSLALSLRREF